MPEFNSESCKQPFVLQLISDVHSHVQRFVVLFRIVQIEMIL